MAILIEFDRKFWTEIFRPCIPIPCIFSFTLQTAHGTFISGVFPKELRRRDPRPTRFPSKSWRNVIKREFVSPESFLLARNLFNLALPLHLLKCHHINHILNQHDRLDYCEFWNDKFKAPFRFLTISRPHKAVPSLVGAWYYAMTVSNDPVHPIKFWTISFLIMTPFMPKSFIIFVIDLF